MRVLYTLCLVMLFAPACMPLRLRPEVTRRYRQISHAEDRTGRHAEITAFSLPVPNSDPNSILALAPAAQAEFVKGVAAHASTGQGIAAPIRSDSPPPGARNLARVSRRVVFSIENRSPNPADRLHSVRIGMKLQDTAMSYVSWDKIATKHNTVDVGSLTFTQGTEVGADLRKGSRSGSTPSPGT